VKQGVKNKIKCKRKIIKASCAYFDFLEKPNKSEIKFQEYSFFFAKSQIK
jgi:hypothetical protein